MTYGLFRGFFGCVDECLGGVALLVAFEEELGADNAVFVDEVRAGVGHAFETSRAHFLSVHGRVADAVGVDGLAAFVGQEREVNVVLVRKALQCFDGVVADADEFDVCRFDFRFIGVQLNQLPLAVGSPIGGTVKDEGDKAVGIEEAFKGVFLAVLILEREGERLVADFDGALHVFGGIFALSDGHRRDEK